MGSLRIIAVILAILAIGIIGYDYCDGHFDSSPFNTDFCPLCASYMSTELTPAFSLLAIQPEQHILCSFHTLSHGSYQSKPLTHHVTHRGPPYTLCSSISEM